MESHLQDTSQPPSGADTTKLQAGLDRVSQTLAGLTGTGTELLSSFRELQKFALQRTVSTAALGEATARVEQLETEAKALLSKARNERAAEAASSAVLQKEIEKCHKGSLLAQLACLTSFAHCNWQSLTLSVPRGQRL